MAQTTGSIIKMLQNNRDGNRSSVRSSNWNKLASSWKVTRDLWGSALDVRELGPEYLVQFPKESGPAYRDRLNTSVFSNIFRETIETMAAIVFRKDPTPTEAHPEIQALFPDIDLCGNTFWAWCLEAFAKYLRDGNGYVYIEAPKLDPSIAKKIETGGRPTLLDRQGDRPYWIFFEAPQLINYRRERVGSRGVFTQATIEQTVTVPDGQFGEREVMRHLILTPGEYQVVEQNKEGEFVKIIDQGRTGLDEIPLYPLNPDLGNVPPLLTLALLNVLSYNQKSDYDNICHLVCTPLRVHQYDSQQDAESASKLQAASPGIGIKGWGQHFNVSYAEVKGDGMELARDRYRDVEKEIANFGISMLSPSELGAIRTATEVLDIAGTRQSKLSKRAREFANALEMAWWGTAKYINAIKGRNTIDLDREEEKARIKLSIEFDRLTFSLEQLSFFNDLVDSGKLSLQTFLEWLPQVADMPAGFNAKEEIRRIARVNTILPEDLDDDDRPGSE